MTTPLDDIPLIDNMEYIELHDERKADLEQALSLLEKHEWAGDFMEIHCIECAQTEEHGHSPNCSLANLLSKYNREVRFHD